MEWQEIGVAIEPHEKGLLVSCAGTLRNPCWRRRLAKQSKKPTALAASLNIKVSVLPKTGHRLGKEYVKQPARYLVNRSTDRPGFHS